ncbi:MAG: CPBP family intramembrane metalloprotease [Tatlockia sp.]|nr:CPBP family intramembrane metalloprotease [Tatlockia sp.]
MQINWPLITVLFCLSLPGVLIAIPRLINLLLPNNSEELRRRYSRFAIAQTLVMTLLMSFAGAVLSLRTGLTAPVLDALLQGKAVLDLLQKMALPTLLYTLGGLLIFLAFYYGLAEALLDEKTLRVMKTIRVKLRPDGCILYSVVEEVIARWGLMNVFAFFAILFSGQKNPLVLWNSIFLSGIFYGICQLPAYLAAGCHLGRRFIFALLWLNLWQALLFGWLFWHYGLVAAIVSHMLFHLGWALYDKT